MYWLIRLLGVGQYHGGLGAQGVAMFNALLGALWMPLGYIMFNIFIESKRVIYIC
jgi:hypothetical protein